MTKLFSALLAGALTISLTPAASAQAWAQVPEQAITPLHPSAHPMNLAFEEGSLERFWNTYQSRVEAENTGSPSWMNPWVDVFDVFNDSGWHPSLAEQDAAEVIREFAPWRQNISAPSPTGTSDRVYEDLLLALSTREDAWDKDFASFDIINDRGIWATADELSIPDGWVVTGACLGQATVWQGDMGFVACVDGYAMRALIEPPRRPHHP